MIGRSAPWGVAELREVVAPQRLAFDDRLGWIQPRACDPPSASAVYKAQVVTHSVRRARTCCESAIDSAPLEARRFAAPIFVPSSSASRNVAESYVVCVQSAQAVNKTPCRRY